MNMPAADAPNTPAGSANVHQRRDFAMSATPEDIHGRKMTAGLAEIIRSRHSERSAYDPGHRPPDADLHAIIEAARWAPTAHNMQNFEIIVVDDPAVLAEIGRVRSGSSAEFIRENYAQLSFSEDELLAKGTGLLATMFPPSWREPGARAARPVDLEHGFLDETMRSCPVVLIVVYDTRKRAPASEGDVLGFISLGCVLQNMWLTAESLGIGLQVMSVFSAAQTATELRKVLSIPGHMEIAYACRLGYAAAVPGRYLRVRRPPERFTHHNACTARDA
jgi:nitroreductase